MKESTKIIFGLAITALCFAGVAYAINNPTGVPTGANGAITTDAFGNIGIGAAPAAKLNIGGSVSWVGHTLTGGGVPWARINPFPANCSNQYVGGLGSPALGCNSIAWGNLINVPPTFNDGDALGPVAVTGITAGTGLSAAPGNPIGGGANGTLTVNNAVIQQRVTGTCASGGIRVIAADGSVTCEPIGVAPVCTSVSGHKYTAITNSTVGASCFRVGTPSACGGKGGIDIYTCQTGGSWNISYNQCNIAANVMRSC